MNFKQLFIAINLCFASLTTTAQTVVLDASSAGEILARQLFPETAIILKKPGAGGKIAINEMINTTDKFALVSTTTFITTPITDNLNYDLDVVAVVAVASPVLVSAKHSSFDPTVGLKGEVTVGVVGYNSVSMLTARKISDQFTVVLVPYKTSGQLMADVVSGVVDYAVLGTNPKGFDTVKVLHIFDGEDDIQLTFALLAPKNMPEEERQRTVDAMKLKISNTPNDWFSSRALKSKWLTGKEARQFIRGQESLIVNHVR